MVATAPAPVAQGLCVEPGRAYARRVFVQRDQYLPIAFFLALLLWGGYTLLAYLGVPVHGAVLLPSEAQTLVKEICGESTDVPTLLCRGWYSFLPFLRSVFAHSSMFFFFGAGSVGFAALFCGLAWLWRGRWMTEIRLSPWKVVALFGLALWLLLTGFSFGTEGDQSVRRMVEPVPEVYTNAKDNAIAVLQENFRELQGDGCLRYIGQTNRGVGLYMYRQWCVQRAFVVRVLPPLLFAILLFWEWLIIGRAALVLLRVSPPSALVEFSCSAALGACGWVVMLWILSVGHLLISPVGWVLVLGIPVFFLRHSVYWLRRFLFAEWTVPLSLRHPAWLLAWVLLGYLALNFLNVIRPFPIGWDDLGSYLNRPRLLVSYGRFIHSMASFQWEYLTSLGFLLFGYDSTFGTIASLVVNWSAGILAILAFFTFLHVFLGGGGLLAALLYYTLPLVGHFSFADMKVDNAVFAMGAYGVFALFFSLFAPSSVVDERQRIRWMLVSGAFAGFAFGMKSTAVMGILALFPILLGVTTHWWVSVPASFFVGGLYIWRGVVNIATISARLGWEETALSSATIAFATLAAGVLLLLPVLPALWRAWRTLLLRAALFGGSAALVVLPWMWYNSILQGNVLPRVVLGVPNTLVPSFDISGGGTQGTAGARSLSPDLAVDTTHANCSSPTGTKEEIDRYWGFRHGWRHYLTLPWRAVLNVDSAGYYVTTIPGLLLFPLLLLLPFFWRKEGRWLRWLWLWTAFFIVEWMFLANGIPWYGVGMLFGLCVSLAVLFSKAHDALTRRIAGVFLACSLLISFANRFWQFDQMRNLLEYPMGKASAAVMRERTIPYYDNIRDVVLQLHEDNPHRPYLYRVGTFIPYFIPRNLEIIGLADHQLDFFHCLHQEHDNALTLRRLQQLGFNSIIFDTNTATIERDSQGSLHTKVQKFVDFLNDRSLGLQVVVNDIDEGVAFVILP